MFNKFLGQQNKNGEDQTEQIAVAPEDAAETSGELNEAARRALASKFRAAAFGEIVSLLMRSPRHNAFKLKNLESIVVPALLTRQYSVAKAKPKDDPHAPAIPVGLAIWAQVSDEVDRRLSENLDQSVSLRANEWTSGDNYWLLDVVAPPKVAAALLDELKQTAFAGRNFKVRRVIDGELIVETLSGG